MTCGPEAEPRTPRWTASIPTRAAAFLIAAACLPLATQYLLRLWSLPHYQFFPLLLAAVAGLLWARWPRRASGVDRNVASEDAGGWAAMCSPLELLLIWAGLLIGGGAVILYSPWLGFSALVVSGFGLVSWLAQHERRRVWPAWALLLLLVRPPLDLDVEFVQWLRLKTGVLSSGVLDRAGVVHFRAGVSIELPGRTLFIEDACSGVHSVFALMSLAAFCGVWMRRPLLSTLALAAAGLLAATAENVLRTVLVVWALAQHNVDLLSEPGHTLLGGLLFLLALAWVLCFDQLLLWFAAPIHDPLDDYCENPWIAAWDRWIAGLPQLHLPAALPPGRLTSVLLRAGLSSAGALGGVLAVLSTAVCLQVGRPVSAAMTQQASEEEDALLAKLARLNEGVMTGEFDDWRLESFEVVNRDASSPLAPQSHAWTFQAPFGRVICSVDAPCRGWHDLRDCYRLTGWTLVDDGSEPSLDTMRCETSMTKDAGEHARLMFATWTGSLEPVAKESERPASEQSALHRRLAAAVAASELDARPTWQGQVLALTARPMSAVDEEDLRRHYELFISRILAALSKTQRP